MIELFVGLGWLRAAVAKVIDPEWWSGATIRDFVDAHADAAVDWYAPVAVEVWAPLAQPLALVVVLLQLVAAFALVTGRRVGPGLAVGMFLNLHFVLAGAVDPSIFYLVCQGALALHLLDRRRDHGATQVLEWLNAGAVLLVAAALPMVRTVHPADVIEDPGAVLATFGALLFLTTATTLARRGPRHERIADRPEPTPVGPDGRSVDE